ncbi:tRNA guanosine(15) transglycosylase TgtA [Halobacterium bonnevillei]|uniref:tRNA-guanine(15) transglycosylase n=1 Tax=Halobacterium bonnevillei TaxID=2692200 RepID=A0A6B0SM45_9EURY|nr:tRNA guanosine(15) transglycosylase TgtA [Halobacterium bonnevillei]MXR19980.1 tRNA guanosine(15) transglycosylase TgtA [Halobacterium bonnevillei]
MREVFEVTAQDGAARIGELAIPRAGVTVETPTLMPVVNPNLITVAPSRFPEFGAEMLITNSYIINNDPDLHERALEEGLHEMLGFDGAIMTDSGSFQLAEYGEIDTDTEAILEFQHEIGSDVGTPVDIPTPPDAGREQVARELAETQSRLELAESVDVGDMLVNAPVQGGTFEDLREDAARHAYNTDLDLFPVGAVVPLMNTYRYDAVADAVLAAKRGLGRDAPVHLFGAGHPMMFALAAALGCDLLDSAAYAIYARDDRYLTVHGTEHLDSLHYFPCDCPICAEHTPDEVERMGDAAREQLLAEHNLHVSFGELRRVKQAIKEGSLMELVEARAHAHPRTLDGYRALLDHSEQLEATDPAAKDPFFYTSADSARRPEVLRHHKRLERFDPEGDVLLTEGSGNDGFDDWWNVAPPFGPYPRALSTTYPLNAETPTRMDRAGYEAAADGVRRLAEANPDTAFTLAHRDWPESALERVPPRVDAVDIDAGDAADETAGE